jgi:hypothetical protein
MSSRESYPTNTRNFSAPAPTRFVDDIFTGG